MQDQNNKEQLNETVNPISELESLVKDPKCTQDLSTETDELINKLENDGIDGINFRNVVEELFVLEKKCRQVSDSNSSCKIVYKIISWFLNYSKDIDESLTTIHKICKKRGQLKKVISYIIQLFLNLIVDSIVLLNPKFANYNSSRKLIETIDLGKPYKRLSYSIKDMDECLKIITSLSEITQGKIYLELERARLMLILSNIKQEDNDLKEASKLLEDVTVETIGNMDLREKTQYVLEQMRLSLLCKDFVRLQIFAKKINSKIIEKFVDLKVVYYQYLIILWHYEQNPKEISVCFLNILNSVANIENNPENSHEKLIDEIPEYMKSPISQYKLSEKTPTVASCIEGYVIYLILGPYSAYIRTELRGFIEKYQKYIERNVQFMSDFLKDYINNEILFLESTKTFNYTIPKYFDRLSNCFFFSTNDYEINNDVYYTEYKRCKINLCSRKDRFTLFMQRIQERNIAVISDYYKTITFQRVQDLFNLDSQELQLVINHLVERGIFSAKINQPAGIITFFNKNNGRFNQFHDNIGTILNKLDLLRDLVSNEMMIHQFSSKVNSK